MFSLCQQILSHILSLEPEQQRHQQHQLCHPHDHPDHQSVIDRRNNMLRYSPSAHPAALSEEIEVRRKAGRCSRDRCDQKSLAPGPNPLPHTHTVSVSFLVHDVTVFLHNTLSFSFNRIFKTYQPILIKKKAWIFGGLANGLGFGGLHGGLGVGGFGYG